MPAHGSPLEATARPRQDELAEARTRLGVVLAEAAARAEAGDMILIAASLGLGKTTAALQLAGNAPRDGDRRYALALPTRELRDEKVGQWQGLGLEQAPCVVRSAAELCPFGKRIPELLEAGYAEGGANGSLHSAVCLHGKTCRYVEQVRDVLIGAKRGAPLVATHAWALSPWGAELLSSHGYTLIVDEAHALVEQREVRAAFLNSYLGMGDTAWDLWASPSSELARLLLTRLQDRAVTARQAAQRALDAAGLAERTWRPAPYPRSAPFFATPGAEGLLASGGSEVLLPAVNKAAAVESPPPVSREIRWAWLPHLARTMKPRLLDKPPAEAGGELTVRTRVQLEAGGVHASSWLFWSRWNSKLPGCPVLLLDATADLEVDSLRAAYPERNIELQSVEVPAPGVQDGLVAIHRQHKSLGTINLLNSEGRLSLRGTQSFAKELEAAVERAAALLGRPVRVGIVARKAVTTELGRAVRPPSSPPSHSVLTREALLAEVEQSTAPRPGRLREVERRLREADSLEALEAVHFHALRGTNSLVGCDLVFVFGDPSANMANANDEAAVLGLDPDTYRADRLLAELVQAIGRGRPILVTPERPLMVVLVGRATPTWGTWAVEPVETHRTRSTMRTSFDAYIADLLRHVGVASPTILRRTLEMHLSLMEDETLPKLPMHARELLDALEDGIALPWLDPSNRHGRRIFTNAASAPTARKARLKLTQGRGRPETIWVTEEAVYERWRDALEGASASIGQDSSHDHLEAVVGQACLRLARAWGIVEGAG